MIAQIVNGVAGPAIVGDDPLAHERIWDKLYWTLMPRGQTGYAAHALAAIDVALWDIKGKALRQPVWRLLGGAHPRVPVYATFGFGFFDREQLAAAAKLWVSQGFTRLKMTVGNEALRHRDKRPVMEVIREDAARVRAVREAVGAGGRAVHRRQLQSRPLSRDQAGRDGEALRHLVLRGAADAERRARHGAASPRDRHGARLRPERGAGVPLPRSAGGARRSTTRSPTSPSPAAFRSA